MAAQLRFLRTEEHREVSDNSLVGVYIAGVVSDDAMEGSRFFDFWLDAADLPVYESETDHFILDALIVTRTLARAAEIYQVWQGELAQVPPPPTMFMDWDV